MSSNELPPCGIYRTLKPIGGVPEGRLVYFHNHGNPGAGIYLPERWDGNRARFAKNGFSLPSNEAAKDLVPLPPEGFYRVERAFYCCEKNCQLFDLDAFVQLGYDGGATPILFVPEFSNGKLTVPERGTRIDVEQLLELVPLKVPVRPSEGSAGDADLQLH